MAAPETESDYDPYVWHDDTIYGMRFHKPDLAGPDLTSPDLCADDWTSLFTLDIDHIVAWVPAGERVRFRVAPADLIFRDVCDLEMAVDWGDSKGQIGLHEPSIDHIARAPVAGPEGRPPRFQWRIALNHPADGAIGFCARGFDLNLRRAPVLRDEQRSVRTAQR